MAKNKKNRLARRRASRVATPTQRLANEHDISPEKAIRLACSTLREELRKMGVPYEFDRKRASSRKYITGHYGYLLNLYETNKDKVQKASVPAPVKKKKTNA